MSSNTSHFYTLKVEYVYRLSFESIDHAKQQIFWFIEGDYSPKRKHSALGYKSPVKFEQAALLKVA
jgi:putative transposase